MTVTARVLLVTLALGALPARAGLECRGVLDFDNGVLTGHARCRFEDDALRRVRAICRDGEPGCDADGACDGSCRFALCADPGCTQTLDVDVPLRRGGRRPGKAVLRAGGARVVLRCRPSRRPCVPGGSTTTTSTTSTSTTLPGPPCSATLSGAVEGPAGCSASLAIGGLGLPVLRVALDGEAVKGQVAALLTTSAPGEYRLGQGVIFAALGLERPDLGTFQASDPAGGEEARVEIESVSASGVHQVFTVHGRLDTTLASTNAAGTVRVQAEF